MYPLPPTAWIGLKESGDINNNSFDHPLFSPDFIILSEIWVQVDKLFKI